MTEERGVWSAQVVREYPRWLFQTGPKNHVCSTRFVTSHLCIWCCIVLLALHIMADCVSHPKALLTSMRPCMSFPKPLTAKTSLCPSVTCLGWQGSRAWEWRFYKFRLRVFSPSSARLETFEATDPYSRSLAADGARSQARLTFYSVSTTYFVSKV